MGQNSPTAEATCISWRAPRLFEQIKRTEKMSAYKPSTLLDWEAGKPLEIESIWGEPLGRAAAAGANTPRLEMVYALLKAPRCKARSAKEGNLLMNTNDRNVL